MFVNLKEGSSVGRSEWALGARRQYTSIETAQWQWMGRDGARATTSNSVLLSDLLSYPSAKCSCFSQSLTRVPYIWRSTMQMYAHVPLRNTSFLIYCLKQTRICQDEANVKQHTNEMPQLVVNEFFSPGMYVVKVHETVCGSIEIGDSILIHPIARLSLGLAIVYYGAGTLKHR